MKLISDDNNDTVMDKIEKITFSNVMVLFTYFSLGLCFEALGLSVFVQEVTNKMLSTSCGAFW